MYRVTADHLLAFHPAFRYVKSDEIVTRLYAPLVKDSIILVTGLRTERNNCALGSRLIVKQAFHSSIGFLYRKQGEQRDTSSPRDFFPDA